MPITRYDEPFKESVPHLLSEEAVEIRERLADEGIIPAQGKVPLTYELMQAILKTDQELPSSFLDQDDSSDYIDLAFKLYLIRKARSMSDQVKVTAKFIHGILLQTEMFMTMEEMELAEGKELPGGGQYRMTPVERNWSEAIKKEMAGDLEAALEYIDRAVECRADILPVLKRAAFLYEHEQPDRAITDLSLAIKEGDAEPLLQTDAYAHRGIIYLEKDMLDQALDDLVRASERYREQLKADLEKDDLYKIIEVEDSCIFHLEECVPKIKSIDPSQESALAPEARQKLTRLKALILSIRQIIDY